jgi:HAE1 family hydrophobic/amphiphilic exporter-1
MKSSLYAFIMAVILTYMVMAFQFESLVVPLVIMVAVPLSSIGVVGGLLLFNKTLCVTAFIGVVMLVGVAVDDAIVLLDFVRQLRDEGVQREEALLMAGEKRVRAILLCTVTTIVGMLPTAMGIGGRGAALQAPLAAAFLAGLSAAMVQTLVVIPVLYAMAEDGSLWVKRRIFRRNV